MSCAPDSIVERKPRPHARTHYLWDAWDKSPPERTLLFKLDAAVLTFACLGYFIKNLDSANINNAFVSGMKEDLGLYGNELNYMGTAWTVGYIIGQIPSNILLTKVRPSIWLPMMELVWTTLTMLIVACTNAKQIYALRFLIGLAESAFYPGAQYIIGSWYRKDELAKRSTILYVSGQVASMFSGYLMASVYNLNGRGGLAGWKWLFIMDGVISFPIAFLGFYLVPDTPDATVARYLTPEERVLAMKRVEMEGRKMRQKWTWPKVRKILASWHVYGMVFQQLYVIDGSLFSIYTNGSSVAPIFAQYLKYSTNPKYTIRQINTYPTGGTAIQIVVALVLAWTSDSCLGGRRWPGIVFLSLIMPVFFMSLAIWDIPEGWKWACLYLTSMSGAIAGLTFSWAQEICSDDNEERAFVTASMNAIAYMGQAWLPLLVWQQVDAPRYRKGYITSTVLLFAVAPTALGLRYLQDRERRRLKQPYPMEMSANPVISDSKSEC